MSSFTPNRALLNPKFEGYKLEVISQEDSVTRFGLQYRASQVANSGRSPLSFKEVQSRITHNHLAMANDNGRCLYVDSEHRIILVNLTNVGPYGIISCPPKSLSHHAQVGQPHAIVYCGL